MSLHRQREPRRVGDLVLSLGIPALLLDMGPADGQGPTRAIFFHPNGAFEDAYAIDFAEEDPLVAAADAWSTWTEAAP